MSADFNIQTELRSAPGELPLVLSVTEGRFGGELRHQLNADSAREFKVTASEAAQTGGPGSGWTEDLAAYRGVRWRRRDLGVEGTEKRAKHIHLVDLVHEDPERTVPLFAGVSGRADRGDTWALAKRAFSAKDMSDSEKAELQAEGERLGRQATGDDVRDVWEGFATLLGLPAIDARGDAESVREAGDLDKSFAELAKEGKADDGWDETPPPTSLEVENPAEPGGAETLQVRINAAKFPKVGMYFLYAVAALMAITGLATGQFGLVIVAIVLGAAPRLIVKLQVSIPRSITITRTAIHYKDPSAGSRRSSFELPLSDIESVHVEARNDIVVSGGARKFLGNELVLSTDRFEHRLGEGLDDDALEWLRRYILAAIARA